ncbi:MAG: helix-turn-helix transcriptional regulator [Chloroflexi bacterium]|nr:helix-turn-helix transcriptional regulator [Chloroflexota bacterium]
MHTLKQVSDLMKAFGHPVRLQILYELGRDEACVCHLEAVTGHRQAYISQQLMRLREAGLVVDRRDGLNVFYSLSNTSISDLLHAAETVAGGVNGTALDVAVTLPTGREVGCCCPKCEPETSPYLERENALTGVCR